MKPVGCNLAPLVERYFTERLIRQQNVSANTIASGRFQASCRIYFGLSGCFL